MVGRSGRSALVIDDDLLIAWAVEETLRSLGFDHVVVAASDVSALHAGRSGPFDLIVSDINLGSFSTHGLSVLRTIDPEEMVPTLILTGYDSADLPAALARYRPRATVLRKPASAHELAEAIDGLMIGRPTAAEKAVAGSSAQSPTPG